MIPPLILREVVLAVSEVTKIHCDEPTVEDHSIYDNVTKLQIPLKLDGIFSYFPTQALTLEEMQRCDEMKHVFRSPDAETWDTYSETYDLNKEQLVDSGGDILYPPPRDREVSEPMEVEEVRTKPLDNMVGQVYE